MTEVTINTHPFQIEEKEGKYLINGKEIVLDIYTESPQQVNVIHEGKSYNVLIHKVNKEEKEITLSVNGKATTLKLRSQTELLLKSLGLDAALVQKIDSIKAPMPGLIHTIFVSEGQAVKKGDPVIILEAMKMENIIKSPGDGIIGKILVESKASVDKGAVLLRF